MIVNKTTSVEEYKIASRFDSLRKILTSEEYARHLEKPLAYWALPTDRRLPLVLLGRTLGSLLDMPFADLTATPGIGQKKIRSFVGLLSRAANTDPTDLSVDDVKPADNASARSENETSAKDFDPSMVSEVVWSKWRATVIKRGLEHETLGRLAPSLRGMTRVNWNTRLGEFTTCSLAEIKARKTHGEKRIHALLEVFHGLHKLLSEMGQEKHLVVCIRPHRIDAVQQWIVQSMQAATAPDEAEVFERFVKPLLDQLHIDATEQVANLADDRVGLLGPITSVREVARKMGLTRARVYQLLNEVNDIMQVRWPSGRREVYELLDKLENDAEASGTSEQLGQFRAAVELFYPNNRRGGASPLERAELAEDENESIEFRADAIVA
jgi:hypothetical protein